jgi:hypothetical protein
MVARAKLWANVHRAISLVLTVVWVGAGATKLAGLEAFRGVLETHDVLPYGAIRHVWAVPAVEIVLGVAVFVAAGRPVRAVLLRGAAVGSAALLLAFCAYVAQVDADVFKAAGCGCAGAWGLTDLIDSPTRGGVIAIDLALLAISLAMLRVPKGRTSISRSK